jgi:capsular polysaccharide biosynthesis protein
MSQQPLNMRRSVQSVRRHKRILGAVVILGLLIGAAYAVLTPPMLKSSALVVLPDAPSSTGQAASSTTAGSSAATDIATQMVIAGSNPVLAAALPHVSPAMSLAALQSKIAVSSLTGNIISVTASGKTAAQAETTANAVAQSYVAYVGAPGSPPGRVLARILQPAASATGGKLLTQIAIDGLLGALAGALAGFIASLVIGQNDRRLRDRDPIANSVGLPVLASFPVEHPADPAGWAKLLEGYEPGPVHSWRLRATLQQLGTTGAAGNGNGNGGVPSVTVLTFASDPKALAIGPQLASFAASLGIPTALVIGPQQDANTTATLRTAGAAVPPDAKRMRNLRVFVSDDGDISMPREVGLVVVVAVVDARTPYMPATVRTATTVLGVSAGAATADQLARAATAAASDDREVTGILVADPYLDDHTTGRIPSLAPPARRPLPTRVTDMPTEIKR